MKLIDDLIHVRICNQADQDESSKETCSGRIVKELGKAILIQKSVENPRGRWSECGRRQ
jgi:hypothetical protein